MKNPEKISHHHLVHHFNTIGLKMMRLQLMLMRAKLKKVRYYSSKIVLFVIWAVIVLFLPNQIARFAHDFKMNMIDSKTSKKKTPTH
jgi:hypothetical protein